MLDKSSKIYVAGHRGMVGSAIWRALEDSGYQNLFGWSSSELDLTERSEAISKIVELRPDAIFLAAARVGGIGSNSRYPVEFLNDNTRIQNNVFEAAHIAKVTKLLFLGSSCIYPKYAKQPIKESSLLMGPLEPTNDAYAIAKIAGILHIQAYRREYERNWISVMPTNLYGPNDNFDKELGHVLPALMSKFHNATKNKEDSVTLWGDGSALREFLHVDDLARACLHLIQNYDDDTPVNVGYGSDVSILELAGIISRVVGFSGQIIWDTTKPNGTPRKLLDSGVALKSGWSPLISLNDGIESTYSWYKEQLLLSAEQAN